MEYLEAVFTVSVSADDLETTKDLLANLAAEAGFEAFEDKGNALVGYVQPQLLDRELLDEGIANFPIATANITYSLAQAENRNWNEEWEAQGFEPICIDERCMIYDARHTSPADLPQSFPLKVGLEPQQAFGSGAHETTRMVVSRLLDTHLQGKRLLDCGCGTGILGIVAAKLGAKAVLAYDVDEWSVDNTRHNAALNGVQNMVVRKGDSSCLTPSDGLFDVVVANINRNILLADLPRWVQMVAQHGLVVLSGFYQTDVQMLVEAAKTLGLICLIACEDEGWACLTFSKA